MQLGEVVLGNQRGCPASKVQLPGRPGALIRTGVHGRCLFWVLNTCTTCDAPRAPYQIRGKPAARSVWRTFNAFAASLRIHFASPRTSPTNTEFASTRSAPLRDSKNTVYGPACI